MEGKKKKKLSPVKMEIETEVEGEGGIFEDLGWKVMMMEGI